jgi:hypothetical protein
LHVALYGCETWSLTLGGRTEAECFREQGTERGRDKLQDVGVDGIIISCRQKKEGMARTGVRKMAPCICQWRVLEYVKWLRVYFNGGLVGQENED